MIIRMGSNRQFISTDGMIMDLWNLRRSDNGVEEEWISATAIMDFCNIEYHYKTGFTNKVGWIEKANVFLS